MLLSNMFKSITGRMRNSVSSICNSDVVTPRDIEREMFFDQLLDLGERTPDVSDFSDSLALDSSVLESEALKSGAVDHELQKRRMIRETLRSVYAPSGAVPSKYISSLENNVVRMSSGDLATDLTTSTAWDLLSKRIEQDKKLVISKSLKEKGSRSDSLVRLSSWKIPFLKDILSSRRLPSYGLAFSALAVMSFLLLDTVPTSESGLKEDVVASLDSGSFDGVTVDSKNEVVASHKGEVVEGVTFGAGGLYSSAPATGVVPSAASSGRRLPSSPVTSFVSSSNFSERARLFSSAPNSSQLISREGLQAFRESFDLSSDESQYDRGFSEGSFTSDDNQVSIATFGSASLDDSLNR